MIGKQNIGDETREACNQDYSPCSCDSAVSDDNITIINSVSCVEVSVQTVRDVFLRVNDAEIHALELSRLVTAADNSISLPADFLGNTRVTSDIYIDCGDANLVINPLAFRISQNSTTTFTIDYCDLSLQKDFNFMNGFNNLQTLDIFNTNNVMGFQYLPPLPSLQTISFQHCSGLNEISFPDVSPAKLVGLFFLNCSINDQTAEGIVTSLTESTSVESLLWLSINLNYNSLTRIPSRVGSSFPRLLGLALAANSISHIPSFSLTFVNPMSGFLNLAENNLKTIENGAFQGNINSYNLNFNLYKIFVNTW